MEIKTHSAGNLLWRYLKPLKNKVVLLTVLLFGSIGLQLIGPQVMRRFLDLAQNGEAGRVLVAWQSLPALAVTFFIIAITQKGTHRLIDHGRFQTHTVARNHP